MKVLSSGNRGVLFQVKAQVRRRIERFAEDLQRRVETKEPVCAEMTFNTRCQGSLRRHSTA
jgi:Flp pilus assembly CpaF family ATPase